MKVLVFAPHPDDEVLGAGGTLSRMAGAGHTVTVAIVTSTWAPLFSPDFQRTAQQEARAANDILGTSELLFMELEVTRLHEMPRHEINLKFEEVLLSVRPDTVLVPFHGDRHVDHREVFEAAMVATRPRGERRSVTRVLCYETVSETHWAAAHSEPSFTPDVFVEVTDQLTLKLESMRQYASQLDPDPGARSLAAIEALARFRGSVVGVEAAEAFQLVRHLWDPTTDE